MHVSLFYCYIQSFSLATPVNIILGKHHEDNFSSKYDTNIKWRDELHEDWRRYALQLSSHWFGFVFVFFFLSLQRTYQNVFDFTLPILYLYCKYCKLSYCHYCVCVYQYDTAGTEKEQDHTTNTFPKTTPSALFSMSSVIVAKAF